jgi:hypothetical protein
MGYVGPVPQSSSGNKYFIALTDLLYRFVVIKVVPDKSSITAAEFLLYDAILVYETQYEIFTDNGRHLTSCLYQAVLQLTGCCHVKITPCNPQANGECERYNVTLVPNIFALSSGERSDWDEKLLPTTFNYNVTRHTTTCYTPFELMFARQPRLVADIASPPPVLELPQYQHHMRKFISHATLAARNNTIERQRIAKTRYNTNRSNPRYLGDQKFFIKNFSSKIANPLVTKSLHS